MEVLRSTDVTPLLRYYDLLRLPAAQPQSSYAFLPRFRVTNPARRISQVSRSLSRYALSPPTPESRVSALACVFLTRAGFTFSGRLATPIFAFRGPCGFACATARTVRVAGLQQRSHPSLLPASLHVSQAFHMVRSFHLTREIRLPDAPELRRGAERRRERLLFLF
jgi:hypothetical protein